MPALNRIQIIGNVGKTPKSRHTSRGKLVVNFSVAVNSSWTSGSGENKKEVEWFNVEVWDKLGEIVQQYVDSGSSVYVEGRLKTDHKEGKTYVKIVASTIQFLGSKNGNGSDQKHVEEQQEEMEDDSEILL